MLNHCVQRNVESINPRQINPRCGWRQSSKVVLQDWLLLPLPILLIFIYWQQDTFVTLGYGLLLVARGCRLAWRHRPHPNCCVLPFPAPHPGMGVAMCACFDCGQALSCNGSSPLALAARAGHVDCMKAWACWKPASRSKTAAPNC